MKAKRNRLDTGSRGPVRTSPGAAREAAPGLCDGPGWTLWPRLGPPGSEGTRMLAVLTPACHGDRVPRWPRGKQRLPCPLCLPDAGHMPVTARQCAVASSTSPERARGLPAPLPAAVGVGSPGSPPQTWRLSVPRETRKPAGARARELRPRWGPASDGQRGLSSCRAGPRGDRKNEEAPTSGRVGPPVF